MYLTIKNLSCDNFEKKKIYIYVPWEREGGWRGLGPELTQKIKQQ